MDKQDKEQPAGPKCSEQAGELNKIELAKIKKSITDAMRYIKPYNGPSKIWFAYQNSLQEGCARLSALVSKLPVSQQTSSLLVKMLIQLDKKLCEGGVDDSDGTVGGFIEEAVAMLIEYAKFDSTCINTFCSLANQKTCFGWEEPLVKLINKTKLGGLKKFQRF